MVSIQKRIDAYLEEMKRKEEMLKGLMEEHSYVFGALVQLMF